MLNRDRLLAEAFPAMILPAGKLNSNAFPSDNNFNMQSAFKTTKTTGAQSTTCWPQSRGQDARWLHVTQE
jgi:hypothetical protein